MRSATSLEPVPPACTVPNEVFLSHSSKDRAFAERLVEVLRRHRIPVWYSKTDILGSQQWHDEIGRALERCDWFIVVLSPDALDSMWVRRELVYCLQENRFEGRIAPLLHRSCNYRKLLDPSPDTKDRLHRRIRGRLPRVAWNLGRRIRPAWPVIARTADLSRLGQRSRNPCETLDICRHTERGYRPSTKSTGPDQNAAVTAKRTTRPVPGRYRPGGRLRTMSRSGSSRGGNSVSPGGMPFCCSR